MIAEEEMKKDSLPLWQYKDSQQFYVFSVKEGEPVPTKPEEALYLCYLYLGSNQPDKAWRILEDCDKGLAGLKGTLNELRYLQWIFNEMPHLLETDPINATVSNPAFEACKLKALSLLTRYKQQGKDIAIPSLITSPANVNDRHWNIQLTSIISFNNSLNDTLFHHYTRYKRMMRDQDVGFQLPAYAVD